MTNAATEPSVPRTSWPREDLDEVLETLKPTLLNVLQDLVRIPSENFPPKGNERSCQQYVAGVLRSLGLEPDIYDITDVPSLVSHPEYWPGRQYAGRPNVNAVSKGSGGGRSLILSGHIDTVPADTPVEWTYAPFGAEVRDGRLFGRGAWDMKAGVAINLTVVRAFAALGWRLQGDLIFETVVDEEFGGANGTLAGRLRGYRADAAVITESTGLRICPAQRGGRTVHILLQSRQNGILAPGHPRARAVDQLSYVLSRLPEFAGRRACRAVDPYFRNSQEPFAVWVTNVSAGKWGWTQPLTIPERCRLELYWQTMPAELREDVEAEFLAWWNEILGQRPDLFPQAPLVELPMRWLPGCSIPPSSEVVTAFARSAREIGLEAPVEGMDCPSDMYIFQKVFGIPALMWGPSGGNAHGADEYVDIESLYQAAKALAHFVADWCGVEPV
jgi:acetylornithine deacetylase